MKNKTIYFCHTTTGSSDHYYDAFDYKPSREEVAKMIMECEGNCESLDYYIESCSYEIVELEVLSKKG